MDFFFLILLVIMCILIVQSCRLQAEQEKLQKIGPLAYYSEWVKAWKRDTSREAVQQHFEETGEDENTQLIEMFTYQTDREYRIMMGTDTRIRRDPLAMRMREDQIKQSTSFSLATSFISPSELLVTCQYRIFSVWIWSLRPYKSNLGSIIKFLLCCYL